VEPVVAAQVSGLSSGTTDGTEPVNPGPSVEPVVAAQVSGLSSGTTDGTEPVNPIRDVGIDQMR
jgi:hypothetical protein